MKKINILFIGILVSTLFLGCGKDFLDEPTRTDVVPSTTVFSSPDGVDAYLSGIYRKFRGQYEYSDNTYTTDVGGIYSMYFARTVKGKDLIQSGWYQFDYANDNREPTYRRVRVTWQYLYDLINQANTIIKGVTESSFSESEKKQYIGHAKALRAYLYLQLALEYAPAYATDPNFPAPPIYEEPTSVSKGMSTLTELYALMLSDINTAIQDMSEDRIDKAYINKQVANAIKAQILMAMNQDWNQVQQAANAAYGGNVSAALKASDYSKGFSNIEATEWLWGMDQSSDQSNYYYLAPHAFTDHEADAYSATYVDSNFVNLFSATDVRKLFLNLYKLKDYRKFQTNKFSFAFDSDMPIIRASEMILAEAEAFYHQGQEGAAHDLLFQLQLNRDPQAVKSSNTGANLLNEILIERRKELYGECGIEWFDAKRLQLPIARGKNHRVVVSLSVNDKRFYLKIPQMEIDNNDLIDESVNANR